MTSFAELHDLTGKVAIVTGGSRGIGRVHCPVFGGAGADVVVASRKLEACEQAAAEIRESTGRKAVAIACHVGHWDDCDHLIAETLAQFGRLDILVNNAGMSPLYESLDAVSEELYDKTFAVNLKGPFPPRGARRDAHGGPRRWLHHQHRHDRFADGERHRTSLRLRQGRPQRPDGGPCRGVRTEECGSTPFFRGRFRTDISKSWSPEGREATFVPLGRLGEPEEVAPLAVHLASAASSYTTGAIIRVDGGITRKV